MITTRPLSTSFDRMLTLNRALGQALGGTLAGRSWVPAMDVAELSDAYVIHAELPGVSPEQVELSFEQNVLTVRGDKPAGYPAPSEGEIRLFAAERVHGSFERAIRLPEFVDSEGIEARFDNGLLTVTVPKARAAQARKINIGVGTSRNGSRISEESGS